MANLSPLQKLRYEYQPKLPTVLKGDVKNITVELGSPTESIANQAEVKDLFKKTYGLPVAKFVEGTNENAGKVINVGVILSGGQAPGGHNVIAGIYDGVKNGNKDSKVFGFKGGPAGIMNGNLVEITPEFMDEYRNTGGFDMIGSGRDKLESTEQFEMAKATCEKNNITSVIIIGGDDSNTNGAVLAEYFAANNAGITVVGCPKTIDGDLKNEHIETSFGFDTACKTYSELIGNIQRDANSAKKYWHFIKLMGRSASHIGLECALQTQPNICIISEEIEAKAQTLDSVVDDIVDVVVKRSQNGDNFGVALIPEGLIEFIPEMNVLISELNNLLAIEAESFAKAVGFDEQVKWIISKTTKAASDVFASLPKGIQAQLLMDRDPHGNVQVSRIETEKLLIEMVDKKLNDLKAAGKFSGSFNGLNHFFGYEGRCAFPSNFDADYCYSLGYTAFLLMNQGLTGYISNVKNLDKPATEWVAGGVPLTMMMNMEQRHGHLKPVIKKALVELDGAPFKEFKANRDEWAVNTSYLFPGAIQYYGPSEVCDLTTRTLALEKK
ncbi:diphosphate--fructose-6-phosphate 1-phosphotransferase [Thiospirochaeta perfilievii]|uniref:Pyrophosphate--fructose 6-phosphate 1-phosphotransferase n=1 Tax=Thiospirochaeta perfilievii TaxID=252967 RepID=A0A5C1QIW6_9SPIO|nr:diphosphate--fructose-6-phosphate 1-phosphotransferase [Thiospirochaeta perfilievii]QEN06122.1 diphosphate--fructose-6-phosphate 1-phosphotransferase [Thiospirochaeta perfilievii]